LGLGDGAGELLKRGWWAIALRGVFAILLGLLILSRPGMALGMFILALGFYLFLDGMFTLVAAFQAARQERSWWPYLIEGLLSIAAGLLALIRPSSAVLFVVLLIAARSLIVGAVELGTGASVRRATGRSPWMLWLGGLASIAFALLLLARPSIGMFALVWTVGVYAIVFGILLEGEAFRFRESGHRHLAHRES
jgi:uncharacterized membrane protein HdeD (DUF308 family)